MATPEFTVCLVTRGDVDLGPALEPYQHLRGARIVVWDNSRQYDHAVFGRYAAADVAETDLIMVQDDDCWLPPESIQALLDAHRPGRLTANQPAAFRHPFYNHHALVGFGACFERATCHQAFAEFWANLDGDDLTEAGELFPRTCDIVFSGLALRTLVDVEYRNLPWADTPERMWRQPQHVSERTRMLELVRQVARR